MVGGRFRGDEDEGVTGAVSRGRPGSDVVVGEAAGIESEGIDEGDFLAVVAEVELVVAGCDAQAGGVVCGGEGEGGFDNDDVFSGGAGFDEGAGGEGDGASGGDGEGGGGEGAAIEAGVGAVGGIVDGSGSGRSEVGSDGDDAIVLRNSSEEVGGWVNGGEGDIVEDVGGADGEVGGVEAILFGEPFDVAGVGGGAAVVAPACRLGDDGPVEVPGVFFPAGSGGGGGGLVVSAFGEFEGG
ncbi:MAG: hypothetical protein QNL33_05915 [Akkermansiaceae bacterium]|jgi:hypothetical protein